MFTVLDTRGVGLLHSVERLMGDVFCPALSRSRNWGELSDKRGHAVRREFLNKLDNFIGEFKSLFVHLSVISAIHVFICLFILWT